MKADFSKGFTQLIANESRKNRYANQASRMEVENEDKSQKKRKNEYSSYMMDFSINYEMKFGQTLGIIGSIPELGLWKTPVKMKWNDGHTWTLNSPLKATKTYFTYKYVILNENGSIARWEAGVDRLADLEILPDVKSNKKSSSPLYRMSEKQQMAEKHVQIENHWEQILLKFSVYTPVDSYLDESIYLSQDGIDFRMKRSPRTQGWLTSKYGTEVVPWECRLLVANTDPKVLGEKKVEVKYNYQKIIDGKKQTERHPQRKIEIRDPIEYKGQLGDVQSSEQTKGEVLFAVNGEIDKCDGNFEGEFFIQNVGDHALGTYPISDQDFKKLKEEKITGILNLSSNQVECDFAQVINQPLDDNLFESCKLLHSMIESGKKVFICCSSGTTSSPTLLISYLCLYLSHKSWQNPSEVCNFIFWQYLTCNPNMRAVEAMLRKNRWFQEKIQKQKEEEIKEKMQKEQKIRENNDKQKKTVKSEVSDKNREAKKDEIESLNKELKLATQMIEAQLDEEYAQTEACKQLGPFSSISSEAPKMQFQPKQFCKLDQMLSEQIKKHNVTIPIIYVKDKVYLIGTQKLKVTQIGGEILIAEQKFGQYMKNNHKIHEKQINIRMEKTGKSYEQVVEMFFNANERPSFVETVQNRESNHGGQSNYAKYFPKEPDMSPIRMRKRITRSSNKRMSRNQTKTVQGYQSGSVYLDTMSDNVSAAPYEPKSPTFPIKKFQSFKGDRKETKLLPLSVIQDSQTTMLEYKDIETQTIEEQELLDLKSQLAESREQIELFDRQLLLYEKVIMKKAFISMVKPKQNEISIQTE